MNKTKTKIAVGTGIFLTVLALFTISVVPTVNAVTVYFLPENSGAEPGGPVYVKLYADLANDETLLSWQTTILFNPAHANITNVYNNCDHAADDTCFNSVLSTLIYTPNGKAWSYGYQPREWDGMGWVAPPGGHFNGSRTRTVKLAVFKVEPQGTPGVSPLNFGFELFPDDCQVCQPSMLFNSTTKEHPNVTWMNGTFTHIGLPETYSTSLGPGWNLISLPLTNTTDMKVSNIIDTSLSGSYDALYKYDASTHSFVLMSSSDTMENGVGYFINMTSADAWTYIGVAYLSMSVGLSDGLNMVGWMNCSKDIVTDTALSSIDGNYWYAARWDTTTQKFENYNPVADAVFDDFTMMNRGEGYFISMKTAGGTLSGSC